MKKVYIYILGTAAICLISATILRSQENSDEKRSYFIDGEEVVFVFDIRDYEQASKDNNGKRMDFSDLDIYRVAVSGEFNMWSRKGWEMKKVGQYTYQLRKSLEEFHDAFPIEFKYIINDEYWAEPGETFPTIRKFDNSFFEDTYNLTLYDVVPGIDGNTIFFLEGHENASEVILTGTFVDWDESFLKMNKVADGWEMRLDLRADRYEYKFIVDGEWMEDPANPGKVTNQHGTFNSLLQVAQLTRFELAGNEDATSVALTTSFNHWSQLPMKREGDVWMAEIPMPAGKYHYKFVVDGRYITDPDNPLRERDKANMQYSVKIVQ